MQNHRTLYKLPGFYIIFLFSLIILTGPKEITTYTLTSNVPLFHLFTWFGIIIGFAGINLYWAGERDILRIYSPIKKWFAYTSLTPGQFFKGKVFLSCFETLILILPTAPFIIMTMVMSGFPFSAVIPVFLIISINVFLCRLILVYFHSTFTGKKFPFSLNFLFMYFWLMLFYIGTFFLFPYANIFSVFLTLEPTLAFLFESLLETSIIHIPWIDQCVTRAIAPVPIWYISFCIHLIILILFIGFFYIKVFLLKKRSTRIIGGKGKI